MSPRARRVLAGGAAVAAAGALAGCSRDIAPIKLTHVRDCLAARGQHPRPFSATGSGVPSVYRRLIREEGTSGGIAVLGRRARVRDAWAYLFFFDGAKRARRLVEEELDAARGRTEVRPERGAPVAVATTRRHNVIVLFGQPRVYGTRADAAHRRVLDRCFDQAGREPA